MPEKILVALKRHDRVAEIIPYLNRIAERGMRVVFLVPYPVEERLWLRDRRVRTESPGRAMMEGRKMKEKYSWDMQNGLAEKRIFPAREALQNKGIEVSVIVYTRSLRKVIQNYAANGDVHLIIMRTGSGNTIERLLPWLSNLFRSFNRSNSPPVLLLDPGQRV